MPTAIKAAFTTDLAISTKSSAKAKCPTDIQYMPPGTHRINASRAGEPVALEISVDAATAETLDAFLQNQLTKATEGNDDRPFFDFNHEDREAAAWPTEFYWAGDDLKTGGVRAKVDWSGAGEKAVQEKTFRRFSPTFIPDKEGKVISSETNMGGLVNRAAFKSIQPLFAKQSTNKSAAADSKSSMKITNTLHELNLIAAKDLPETEVIAAVKASVAELNTSNEQLAAKVAILEAEKVEAVQAHAASQIEAAVSAGRIAPADEDAKSFWLESLIRDEAKAVKALEALPSHPVLATVTAGEDAQSGLLDKMTLQTKKLAEVQAANPQADFQTVFAKAQTETPDLFR